MTTLAARSAPAADAFPRRLSPGATRSGGFGPMLAAQARAELLKVLRAPDFVAPVVLLPVLLFALFGSSSAGQTLPTGFQLGPVMAAGFTAYGVLGIAMFSFGEGLATERGQGWLRLVRATPVPAIVFLGGKLAAAIALVTLFMALMIGATTVLGTGVEAAEWVRLTAVSILGVVVLAPVGSVVGLLVRPSAGGAVSLLVYLPLSFASGMWTPIEVLPEPVRIVAPWLPTYHLSELSRLAVGGSSTDAAGHVLWLLGTLVVATAIAALAYRRVAGRQFA